jgi:hypothetical protein
MWKLTNQILTNFRQCFTRKATFNCFVIIVIGLMIRTDTLGITSIIRDLNLLPNTYDSLIHFFRSDAWMLETINHQWMKCVKYIAPIYNENEFTILVGDGVKQSKEARKMPGVKRLHQESENSSKAEYIFGHLFGGIGVLAGNSKKIFCIPLLLRIHDGIKIIRSWQDDKEEIGSHVVELVKDAFKASEIFDKTILLLDRYYLSIPALKILNTLNEKKDQPMHIITNAKKSCIAYTKPIASSTPKRGRPRKKGDTIKLKELFVTMSSTFTKTTLKLYGKLEEVEYLSLNLLWGQGLYLELQFVLVKYKGKHSILVTTKLDLNPTKVIELYACRFKIECTFRELKQVIGGFCYQFWSKAMPKLNRYAKKEAKSPFEAITSPKERELIIKTVKAIECYVQISIIALGILQIISLKLSNNLNDKKFTIRFLRTKSNQFHSEATIACFLRKRIYCFIENNSNMTISKIIKSKQTEPFDYEDLRAS